MIPLFPNLIPCKLVYSFFDLLVFMSPFCSCLPSYSNAIWAIQTSPYFLYFNSCPFPLPGGKLYALGGYDGNSYLNSVECYNPKSKEWTEVAPLRFSRSCFAAAVADGYLYALGGYGPSYLSTVERYDPGTDTWEMMPAMSTYRINFGIGVINGCLYVVGECLGCNQHHHLCHVLKLNNLFQYEIHDKFYV